MSKYKTGDKVKIIENQISDSDKSFLKNYPDLIGYIFKVNNNDYLVSNVHSTYNECFDHHELMKLEDFELPKELPEPPQEEIFIPSCSSCFNRHHSAMDKTKPCYGCYGGDNSNFVCMGGDTTQG